MLNKIKLAFNRPYWKDKLALSILSASLFVNIALWIYLRLIVKPTSQPIILHYSVRFGPDILGEYFQIFSIALVGTFIILINAILSDFIYSREKLAALFLTGNILIVEIFLFIAGITIGMIN